jgi:hypothetical protein
MVPGSFNPLVTGFSTLLRSLGQPLRFFRLLIDEMKGDAEIYLDERWKAMAA